MISAELHGPVAVVGTTSWGGTLALILARRGVDVRLLARTEDEAQRIASDGELAVRLPGHSFPPSLGVTADWAAGMDGAPFVLFAVPSHTLRDNARRAAPHLPADAIVVSACKGLEQGTFKRMSVVLAEELPDAAPRLCALSGPNLAREIVRGLPSATVVASASLRPGGGGAAAVQLADVPRLHERRRHRDGAGRRAQERHGDRSEYLRRHGAGRQREGGIRHAGAGRDGAAGRRRGRAGGDVRGRSRRRRPHGDVLQQPQPQLPRRACARRGPHARRGHGVARRTGCGGGRHDLRGAGDGACPRCGRAHRCRHCPRPLRWRIAAGRPPGTDGPRPHARNRAIDDRFPEDGVASLVVWPERWCAVAECCSSEGLHRHGTTRTCGTCSEGMSRRESLWKRHCAARLVKNWAWRSSRFIPSERCMTRSSQPRLPSLRWLRGEANRSTRRRTSTARLAGSP